MPDTKRELYKEKKKNLATFKLRMFIKNYPKENKSYRLGEINFQHIQLTKDYYSEYVNKF